MSEELGWRCFSRSDGSESARDIQTGIQDLNFVLMSRRVKQLFNYPYAFGLINPGPGDD